MLPRLSCRCYKVVTSTENYSAILSKLREEGIKFEPDNGSELLPITPIEVCEYGLLDFLSFYLILLLILDCMAHFAFLDIPKCLTHHKLVVLYFMLQ